MNLLLYVECVNLFPILSVYMYIYLSFTFFDEINNY